MGTNVTECQYEHTDDCIRNCHGCKHGERMCKLRVSGTRGTKSINIFVDGQVINIISEHVEDMTDKEKRKEVRKALQKAEKLRMKAIEREAKNKRRMVAMRERALHALKNKIN